MSKLNFALQWHITNRCDQRCRHCYIFNSDSPVSASDVELGEAYRVINDYVSFCKSVDRNPYMAITGGDPLLHPDVWSILGHLKEKGVPYSLMGNPFHLNERSIAQLMSLGCRRYQLSVDGLETAHDLIRKKGSYQETIEKIVLAGTRGLSLGVMSTVSLLNYKDIPKLTELLSDLPVYSCAFARYCPTHDDLEYNMSPTTYREFLAEMWRTYSKLSDNGVVFPLKDHLWKLFLYENGLMTIPANNTITDGCNCGVNHMTLLEDGSVYACRRFNSPVGNIHESSFAEIFFSKTLDSYRDIDRIEECGGCELLGVCRGCGAVSAGVYGSFFSKDPQCWKNTGART